MNNGFYSDTKLHSRHSCCDQLTAINNLGQLGPTTRETATFRHFQTEPKRKLNKPSEQTRFNLTDLNFCTNAPMSHTRQWLTVFNAHGILCVQTSQRQHAMTSDEASRTCNWAYRAPLLFERYM